MAQDWSVHALVYFHSVGSDLSVAVLNGRLDLEFVDMSINKGLMTSATDQWATPQDFFDQQNALHGPFDVDVCADITNAKCSVYFDKDIDGLKQTWTGKCWMNPPYGRDIGKWMKKACESAGNGTTVVCLVPARTDTKWWHDYAVKGQITFIRGRLKFGGSKNSAPFPSALVVFR
jgi:phage N-6-adenine-methyltransferase